MSDAIFANSIPQSPIKSPIFDFFNAAELSDPSPVTATTSHDFINNETSRYLSCHYL